MSNEFDLERAKRGEPVMYASGSPVRYIGESSSGFIVVEDCEGYFLACVKYELRMMSAK